MQFCQTKLPPVAQPVVFPRPDKIGTYTNKIHYLRKYLLDELPKKKFSLEFMNPVDPLKVPDYYTIIQSPMDVGTIKERVQNFYYRGVNDLIHDLNLMISNCKMFYQSEDRVYRDCLKLEKFFGRVLEKMPIGEEKPSTKDPNMLSRQHLIETSPDAIRLQCEEKLKCLINAIEQESDRSISNYVLNTFEDLSRKVKLQQFRSVQQFNYEVSTGFDEILNNLDSVQSVFNPKVEQKTTAKPNFKDLFELLKDIERSPHYDHNKYNAVDAAVKVLKQTLHTQGKSSIVPKEKSKPTTAAAARAVLLAESNASKDLELSSTDEE